MPDRTILFGSYAHGTPTEDSDVDLPIKQHTEKKVIERDLTFRHSLWSGEMPPVNILVRIPQELTDALARVYIIEAEAVQKGRILYVAA